jgi:hypothetical protein
VRFATVFNDFTQSSLGILLFDHSAYALDTLSFYLDRRATDLYMATARTRRSVALLSRQLGYKMSGAVASSVDLEVGVVPAQPFSVPLPERFQFQGPEGLVFETAEAFTYAPGDPVASIPAYEGETLTESFVSDGSVNQVFELRRVPDGKFISDGSPEVTVDGGTWEESDFLTFDETDQFELDYNSSPPTLRFGDGTAGNIPPTDSSIVIRYIATSGKAGRVASGTITEPVTPLTVNFTAVSLTVNNPEGSKGGDDPESLEHAKDFAPRVWKTRDVAVTQEDYESLAGAFADPVAGRVAVAKAIASRASGTDATLQNALSAINTAVTVPVGVIDGAVSDITTALDTIDAALALLATNLTDIATEQTTIDTNLTAAIASARNSKNTALEMLTDGNDIKTLVTDGKSEVDLYGPSGSAALSASEADGIKAFFDRIDAEADQVVANSSTIRTQLDAEIAAMGQAKDAAGDVGLTITDTDSLLESAETNRTTVVTEVGVVGPPATGIREDLETISAANTGVTTEVNTQTQAINDHFDRILSNDCKANLVSVPILSRDSGGFYVAPSQALISALQTFLDSRKEVTQTVSVTSGELFLVEAVIAVRVGVSSGTPESVVQTSVTAVVDNLLRDRAFGATLFLSDLYDVIQPIEGVAFTNVTIEGELLAGGSIDPLKLDADGNLVVAENEVVTKGTVTVSPEAA